MEIFTTAKTGNEKSQSKNNLITVIGVIIIILSAWSGLFDVYAEEYINQSILDAGIIYAAARGINAIVSVIQSADINLLIASVSPGEMLDPINDLVERFSQVMTLSIASLALQKILLLVAKHNLFNVLLTVSGLLFLTCRLLHSRYTNLALKGLIILVFVRISLALVVLANGAVDIMFIRDQSEQHYQSLVSLEEELNTVAGSISGGMAGNTNLEFISTIEEEISPLENQVDDLSEKITAKEIAIDEQEAVIEAAQSEAGLIDRYNVFKEDDQAVAVAKSQIEGLESELGLLEADRDQLQNQIEKLQEDLDCAVKRSKGETCSFSEWFSQKSDIANITSALQNVMDSSKETMLNVITLIAIMMLKSVLLPLLFWVVIYKTVKQLWLYEVK